MLKKNQQMKKRKKMLYELMCCKEYQPMRAKELAILLQIPSGKREELHKSINKRGRYEAVRKIEKKKERVKEQETQREEIFRKGHCYTGTFISHPRGFGFVQVEEMEGARDIFIPEEGIGTAFHGDKVHVVLKKEEKDSKRREGTIAKVLERGMGEIVGTYEKSSGFGFVVPDNQRFLRDILVPEINHQREKLWKFWENREKKVWMSYVWQKVMICQWNFRKRC